MTPFLLALTLVIIPVAGLAAWSRHKKSAAGLISFVGSEGTASGDLTPEGFIFLDGELFPAVLATGAFVEDKSAVIVTGSKSFRLEVVYGPKPQR